MFQSDLSWFNGHRAASFRSHTGTSSVKLTCFLTEFGGRTIRVSRQISGRQQANRDPSGCVTVLTVPCGVGTVEISSVPVCGVGTSSSSRSARSVRNTGSGNSHMSRRRSADQNNKTLTLQFTEEEYCSTQEEYCSTTQPRGGEVLRYFTEGKVEIHDCKSTPSRSRVHVPGCSNICLLLMFYYFIRLHS